MGHARVWFDELPTESIDSFEDMRKSFLSYFLQQKKYAKDPVELHHIKQREGESTGAFVDRFKAESMHVKGALECIKISGFMHGITNPELIKRLNDNIPQSVDEMWKATTAFLRGATAVADQSKKKQDHSSWKVQENEAKVSQNSRVFERKTEFKGRSKADRRRSDRSTPSPRHQRKSWRWVRSNSRPRPQWQAQWNPETRTNTVTFTEKEGTIQTSVSN
jgi:hypothetical protein